MRLRYVIRQEEPDFFFAVLFDTEGRFEYQVYTDRDGGVVPEVVSGAMENNYDAAGLVEWLIEHGSLPKGSKLI